MVAAATINNDFNAIQAHVHMWTAVEGGKSLQMLQYTRVLTSDVTYDNPLTVVMAPQQVR